MSTADGWDLTVPDDEAEPLAELRRHGVTPGKRFHVVETSALEPPDDEPRARRSMRFVGAVKGGPSDVSRRVDDYLAEGFGR